jgi:hypothetical protein
MTEHWTDQMLGLLNPVDHDLLPPRGLPVSMEGAMTPSPPRRRRWPAVIGGVAVLIGGATAYAATQTGSGDHRIVNLQCKEPNGDFAGQVATGNPIADCTALWQRDVGGTVPPLTAYVFNNRTYYVQDARLPAPTGPMWRALAQGVVTDPAVGELKDALGDLLTGPPSSCSSTDQVRGKVSIILGRLGLADVPVSVLRDSNGNPRTADGKTMCAFAELDTSATNTSVALFSMDPGMVEQNEQVRTFLERMRARPSCQSLPAARQSVLQAATAAGLDANPASHELVITEFTQPEAHCTQVYLQWGGGGFVTLRGPKAAA